MGKKYTFYGVAVFLFVGFFILRPLGWQGSAHLHTIMECCATLLAAIVGILALIRYYTRKTHLFLFIGSGFLGTAILDGYHAFVSSTYFEEIFPSPPASLVPWSWIASRIYLSVMMWLSLYSFSTRSQIELRRYEYFVYWGSGILTVFCFVLFAFVPLPAAYYPGLLFPRPEEFIPSIFFLLALVGYLKKGHWKEDAFQYWLILSLIVNLVGQMAFMSTSSQLFDTMFDAAHLLKKVSYIAVLAGLLYGIYTLFRLAEDETVQTLEALFINIQKLTDQLTPAIDQLREISSRVASGARETVTAVQQVTTTSEEIKNVILNSASQAVAMKNAAEETRRISQDGKQSIQYVIEGMDKIGDQMVAIGKSIEQLLDKHQTIFNIVEKVDGIAGQSSILAVNAAMEASKSDGGDAGFRVVADEMRSLARQSKNATAEIRSILLEVQQSVQSLVTVAEQGHEVVENGAQLSRKSGESIRVLSASIDNAVESVAEVVANGNEQINSIEQITTAMRQIADTCRDYTSITSQLENSAKHLQQLSVELENLIGQHGSKNTTGGLKG